MIANPLKGNAFQIARRLAPQASQTAGILWELRNPSATNLVVLQRARLQLLQVGAPTAAIEDRFSLKIARGFTAVDATGSADITPTTNDQKLRTSFSATTSLLRESTAAGGATAGTKTLDTNAIALGSVWVPIALQTASIEPPTEVFNFTPDLSRGIHPPVFAQNEGFAISNENSLGTASGIILLLELIWSEVLAF